ncbi:nuclear transport factor 2 family protein [uncultured Winogradskyella sp.]|uniref:nuclear transport factor 2 family protein n=1 Tax=uncultured Winogradskyella sp. TaxID=395353 RepID=UPI002614D65B|nr:nuclear transport factor 2 family protein [uncultured Winogradskyella sp.]
MKNYILLVTMLLTIQFTKAQSKADEDAHTSAINLVILNDKGDVLIKKASIGWITIGAFYEKRQTISEVIDSISTRYGVYITKPNLKGVFTYKFDFNNAISLRQFYVAKSTTNALPTNKNVEFRWVPKDEAIEKFKGTIPCLGEMIAQIIDYPQVVWGGSFLIKSGNKKRTSIITEDFYPISDASTYGEASYHPGVVNTLQKYMEGSSYNKRELLLSAFAENATLYLTNRDGDFKRYSPSEYADFFKNAEQGTFNGRVAKILEVTVTKDIATAKVEIAGPNRAWVYMDLFLLKKFDTDWKIISKTATRIDEANKNAVLFVVSNAHYYGNTDIPTGNSFSEIINAYDVFKNANYRVDFVSPNGGAVPLAYINTSDALSKHYLYDPQLMHALKHTKSPSEIDASEYKAIQYIGGGAAMFGVPENKDIQTIAMEIYEKYKGIISSVCHGTAGIVHLKTKDGNYLVDGKSVSGYPDDYENKEAPYFKTFPFLIKKTIEERGGDFKFSERGKYTLEVDGRLVTGQNFQSSKPVSLKIIELIDHPQAD